jgi:hypothetical protein
VSGRQELDKRKKKRHDGLVLLTDLPIELFSSGQLWESHPQVTLRIAIKAPLATKALPLPKDGQGHDFTPAEGRLRPRLRLGGQNGLAKVVCQDIKSG